MNWTSGYRYRSEPVNPRWSAWLTCVGLSLCAPNIRSWAESDFPLKPTGVVAGQPFERFETTDVHGRTITFYISEENHDENLPLAFFIHGSSGQSLFRKLGDRIVGQSGQSTVADVMRGRARLVVVEKPGVEFLSTLESDHPDAGDFRREHSFGRWCDAISACLKASQKLDAVDGERILVTGHSEGGMVASKVAADNDEVTHVAVLAGGGPSQLFSIAQLTREGEFFDRVSDDAEKRVQFVFDRWKDIQRDPTNTEKTFFGHSYLRWATFMGNSTAEQLTNCKARIFIAQGTSDRAVAMSSFDMLQAHLLSKGKDVTAHRVDGVDHSFSTGKAGSDGWAEIHTAVRDWFLDRSETREGEG